jgi:ABC-type Na+ efflux pump permease subunit
MRPAWWTIARVELILAIRDRGSLVWSLIAPVAMAWIFGAMFGGNEASQPTHVSVDAGANPTVVSERMASLLEARGLAVDSTAAEGAVRIELPDSLIAALRGESDVVVQVHKGDASDRRVQAVSAGVRDAMYRIAFGTADLEDASSGRRGNRALPADLLVVASRPLGAAPKPPGGPEHTLPAMLVMFIMFQLTTFFLVLWVDDLNSGKTRRIAMSPTRTRDILLAQVVARLVWGALQVAIILGMGSLVLGVRLDVQPVHLAVLLLAYMLAAASLGMLLASFFRSIDKANAVGVIVSLVMAALGGCWWPLEIVPGAMRKLALIFPTGEVMDALGGMTALGPSAPFPASNVAVLLVMAFVMMPLAARRMRAQLTG